MKGLLKLLTKGILICLIIGILCSMPTVYRGYIMYQDAVSTASVSEKAEQIQNQENYVKLDQISDYFREQIIKSEDKRFRFHFGIDPLAIARAVKNDILAGAFVEGGSTITQQLAKNMYFDFDKNLERKVAEVFVAFQLERDYTKDEILEMYLNCIYFGENCYGIKEAAAHYYGLAPSALSERQSDSLVYTIKCPNCFNPNEATGADYAYIAML